MTGADDHEDAAGTPDGDDSDEADQPSGADDEAAPEAALPDAVVDRAERLTRLARRASDDQEAAAYRERRDADLAEHGFTARVRTEGTDETLICYPLDWVDDGTVYPDRIDDIDRAVERSLTGAGDPDEWDHVAERNREIAATVRAAHGDAHGENAAAFATYMSNHHAKPVAAATVEDVDRFLSDYYVRNVWPSGDQRAVVAESVALALAAADAPAAGAFDPGDVRDSPSP
ncbi:MAG: hypothetical protein ABEJ08_04840 [Halobacteriaceae archaeon]